jgi:hypothetical protein
MPWLISFAAGHWRAVGALVIVLLLAGYIETLRLERDHAYSQEAQAKADLAVFKAHVEAIGKQAQADKIAHEAADKLRKETADSENSAALATLAGHIAELRARPGSGRLPSPPACSDNPARADRFRSESERAYGDLVAGLRKEADRCSKAVVDLNSGKRWAQDKR